MSRLIAVVVAMCASLFLASAPQAQQPATAADEGVLVYSVSTIRIAMNFSFHYRQTASFTGAPVPERVRSIECRCVGIFRSQMANPDFAGRETGKVFVVRLPAGQYEVFDFGFGGTMAGMGTSWSSGTRFSMPFTIHPGQATYIGNFARAPSLGTPLEGQLGAAGFFVVSDKSERDLAIARSRDSTLSDIDEQVTDVERFSHAALRSAEP
ncbi:MAG: hypothetical protein JHC81_00475 [Brevundimonas sp.]|uniref:hypothetical protein n=1 Tax=Brevundimonas sp. TaxID=1871086 RepID=UPI001A32FE3B|nr:hypothetical protein [Brevundimonas sp.]MBJ7445983.1 hypothetical protein [Brevundimonas sp.]